MAKIVEALTNKYVVFLSVAGATGGGLLLWRSSRPVGGGAKYKLTESQEGKTFLITGANSGLGKEATLALAKKKARVIMACRDMNQCRTQRREIVLTTGNKKVVCRQVDLASCDSIQAFAERMLREENVDVLINNAGVLNDKKRKITKDGFEEHIGVNYLGHFLLTVLLVDRMVQRAVSARILNVTGISHPNEEINWDDFNREHCYTGNRKGEDAGTANLCRMMFTRLLAKKLDGTNVTVNAVYPGSCNTALHRTTVGNRWFLSRWTLSFLNYTTMRSPLEGANQLLYAATSPDLDGVTCKYLADCAEKEPNLQSQNRKTQLRLWATSEKWTKARERKSALDEKLRTENPPEWIKEMADSGKIGWTEWITSFWSKGPVETEATLKSNVTPA